MPEMDKQSTRDLIDNFESKIASGLGEKRGGKKGSASSTPQKDDKTIRSAEYEQFKKELLPKHFTLYEQVCNTCEKILKIKPDPKKEKALMESINVCHLNATPTGVASAGILIPLGIILLGAMISLLLFKSMFYLLFFLVAGAAIMGPLNNLPHRLAESWRMSASNQMVLCIFYVVTYMRHTSNLEIAIEFASDHLAPPLSLDLKKVLWNVETEKFDSVNDSLENYLETWRKYNMEFIESFNLCIGSLYESSEQRRLLMLDKSLSVILEETYEKMLHYAHNLKSPITMLHMLGVILPILGLVILPLIVSFMDSVKWHHIAAVYNVALPLSVYFLGKSILSKRPTGYGDTDIAKDIPEMKKYENLIIPIGKYDVQISAGLVATVVFLLLLIVGLSPLLIHMINPTWDLEIVKNKFWLLEYRESKDGTEILGPYGLGSTILSLFIPLSIGIGLGVYYSIKSNYLIKIRDKAKQLEKEFASGLFHLAGKLGDGLPAEIAFGKVATMLSGTATGSFFELVNSNITRLGMSVESAIFTKKVGAINQFPSDLIESTMKVLIESSKRGPMIASQALLNVSEYIKEMHRVDERLKDLLADIISSMKSQISFLTPTIAAIVTGITAMITTILGKLTTKVGEITAESSTGSASSLLDMFSDGIPTYYFAFVVGIYVVEIVFILTALNNGIQNGTDKLNEKYLLGKNMTKSVILYCVIATVITVLFNSIASTIMATL